ncbi:MAG: helix-turn-helix domain-containing protein [Ilumatobacteraceae bacterium]
MTEASPDFIPRSIGRVLDVLEAVVDAAPCTLTAVAQATALTPTTALRHLRALDHRGYVQRDDAGLFSPGAALRRVAGAVARLESPASLVDAARPFLDSLAADTGESAYLAIASGPNALYLATAESSRAIRHVGWAGRAVPLAGSAVGEALAGHDGARVRRGAVEPDITAVACAVRVGGPVVAAVSVVGPSHRLRGRQLTDAKRQVVEAADRLGDVLGGVRAVAS